ncbi:L-histidine N(alpha)-methyltransferase [Nocardioides donggukensis]|uniref:Histidine N-alpha-methyltransferase n=1 Tax=Nocardioides donggukensis TaxID=2774019 RepID=A0A927PZ68_9ACTN|nr:L-histidine N(alpha)-methyltransferase [Nocardioides donggukensis]MBD8869653.1 L-histidine N(alpha)-methyltransferase [Nocardioides donggukensis]
MPVADVAVHLDPGSLAAQMAVDVRAGLTASPKTLPPKYFYDARGSELFDEITRLPEYYPTRTEWSILEARVGEIAAATGAHSLIELGSGTSEKTRLLLHALQDAGTLAAFVPFDVDPAVLAEASAQVADEFPGIEVAPVVGDFERHLSLLPGEPPRLMAFLGSTLGNLEPDHRSIFLRGVRSALGPDDAFLLGTDLVKAPERLVAAYDDAQGVTAAFNKNVLSVLNRDLGADLDPTAFEHVARWDPDREWMEMRLRSLRDQQVRVAALDLDVVLAEGEEVRTEVSAKFRREGISAELEAAGLRLTEWWTDPAGDFALSLSRPA